MLFNFDNTSKYSVFSDILISLNENNIYVYKQYCNREITIGETLIIFVGKLII